MIVFVTTFRGPTRFQVSREADYFIFTTWRRWQHQGCWKMRRILSTWQIFYLLLAQYWKKISMIVSMLTNQLIQWSYRSHLYSACMQSCVFHNRHTTSSKEENDPSMHLEMIYISKNAYSGRQVQSSRMTGARTLHDLFSVQRWLKQTILIHDSQISSRF